MQKIKRIPYGIGDFEAVNANNEYYVDKTMYIPKIEMSRFVFLIRPRRFGKTLFLSTLQSYYDIKKKERFEEFYRDTYILKNPTDERAKYMVLYFNFAMVTKQKEKIQEDFNNYCCLHIDGFLEKYKDYISEYLKKKVLEEKNAHSKLYTLAQGLSEGETKIYLMIDEYDNFTNSIMAEYGTEEYKKITKTTGYFRDFFTVLKGMASGSGAGLARMFITGVSPVTMDDVTSGFNIGDNISIDARYNGILGFTEKDVEEIIDYYTEAGVFKLEKQKTLDIMKKWYNNYQFSNKSKEKVYNTDAVLYFMTKSYEEEELITDLIDDNLRMDYGKLRHLITTPSVSPPNIGGDREGVLNGNFEKLKEILENGEITGNINKSFPYDRLGDRENFISLLLFFGLLTFSGETVKGESKMIIPNESIKSMMYEYIRASLYDVGDFAVDVFEFRRKMQNLAYDGEWKSAFEFMGEEIKKQTRVRDYIKGEKVIQTFFLSYFNIVDYYLSLSEEELSKGYADMVLKPFYAKYTDIAYSYLIEFKYIKRTEKKEEYEEKLKEKIKESQNQLLNYSNDEYSKKMLCLEPYGKVKLKKVIVIFHGWELVYLEEV